MTTTSNAAGFSNMNIVRWVKYTNLADKCLPSTVERFAAYKHVVDAIFTQSAPGNLKKGILYVSKVRYREQLISQVDLQYDEFSFEVLKLYIIYFK